MIGAGMAEDRVADASSRRLSAAAAIIVCGAVAGLAYWYERAYRRWAEKQDPFAVSRTRLERARTTYRDRSALVTELARIVTSSTGAGRPPAS